MSREMRKEEVIPGKTYKIFNGCGKVFVNVLEVVDSQVQYVDFPTKSRVVYTSIEDFCKFAEPVCMVQNYLELCQSLVEPVVVGKHYKFSFADMEFVTVSKIDSGIVYFHDFFNEFHTGYGLEKSFKECAIELSNKEVEALKKRNQIPTFGWCEQTSKWLVTPNCREYDQEVMQDWFDFKDRRETTTKTLEKFLDYRESKRQKFSELKLRVEELKKELDEFFKKG
jgi:hypothetical protein